MPARPGRAGFALSGHAHLLTRFEPGGQLELHGLARSQRHPLRFQRGGILERHDQPVGDVAVGVDRGRVILRFTQPVGFAELDPQVAFQVEIEIGELLAAAEADRFTTRSGHASGDRLQVLKCRVTYLVQGFPS